MNKNIKQLIHELKHHLPFTLFATIVGIVLVLSIQFILKISIEREAFEILHPIHVIASGAVSAGVFYRYRKNFFLAIIVGVISSISIGSISDIFFPFLGGIALLLKPEFHLPIIEKPIIILSSAILGSIIGIKIKITHLPHAIHVFISVFASLFYLIAFTNGLTIIHLLISIIIISLAVVIPCCISDILMPFFFLGKKIENCDCKNKH